MKITYHKVYRCEGQVRILVDVSVSLNSESHFDLRWGLIHIHIKSLLLTWSELHCQHIFGDQIVHKPIYMRHGTINLHICTVLWRINVLKIDTWIQYVNCPWIFHEVTQD